LLKCAALGCLLAAGPLACLKYPWMPATIAEYAELQHDPYPWGSASYHEDRARRLERVRLALLLYALGSASLVGLGLIAANVPPRFVQTACWIMTSLTGAGVVHFEKRNLGASPDYVLMAIYAPLAIAVVSGIATLLSLVVRTSKPLCRTTVAADGRGALSGTPERR
jgi:hypothetical protein